MILAYILYFIVFITLVIAIAGEYSETRTTLGGYLLGLLASVILFVAISESVPSVKPIDVYRGNTTLEITYRDSIAIDSIVVWKDKLIEEK